MENTTVVICVSGGVVQDVLADKRVTVKLVDFDLDDTEILSDKYVELLQDKSFQPMCIEDL